MKFLKVVLTMVLVIFAISRFSYYESLNTRMDLVFLSLVLAAFLLWMLPWEDLWNRLRGFSLGGFTISLEQPDVQAAIGNVSFDEEHLERIFGEIDGRTSKDARHKLLQRMESLKEELQTVRESRVLWIDDNPHSILGERRLLRALGIDVTPARSSEEAEDVLEKDNDFDLIISDVQRRGTNYKLVDNGVKIHEGVNFIVKLQEEETDERIKTLPLIFYGAYPWDSLVKFTRPARALRPGVEISNTLVNLIPKVITTIAEERENPITIPAKKAPTNPSEGDT